MLSHLQIADLVVLKRGHDTLRISDLQDSLRSLCWVTHYEMEC